jgi:hypothetical protein
MSGHIRRADMTYRDDFIFPSMARAEHDRQLGGESPLSSLMAAKG